MNNTLNRAGIFRAEPVSWTVTQYSKGATALEIKFRILELLNPETNEWDDWRDYAEQTITGYHYIVKTDGTLNDKTVEQIVTALGWSGKFEDLGRPDTKFNPCQIQVNTETYNGQDRLKVGWLNPWDFQPGGKPVEPSILKQLDTRFGAQVRATVGNNHRAATPPPPVAAGTKDETPF